MGIDGFTASKVSEHEPPCNAKRLHCPRETHLNSFVFVLLSTAVALAALAPCQQPANGKGFTGLENNLQSPKEGRTSASVARNKPYRMKISMNSSNVIEGDVK
jgi:hypothetical protein